MFRESLIGNLIMLHRLARRTNCESYQSGLVLFGKFQYKTHTTHTHLVTLHIIHCSNNRLIHIYCIDYNCTEKVPQETAFNSIDLRLKFSGGFSVRYI